MGSDEKDEVRELLQKPRTGSGKSPSVGLGPQSSPFGRGDNKGNRSANEIRLALLSRSVDGGFGKKEEIHFKRVQNSRRLFQRRTF